MGKLIKKIPGLRLRQASRCQQAFSKPCMVNLISKDTHLVFTKYSTTLFPNFYPVNLQHFSHKHALSIRVEISVDPDQMASLEAS